MIRISGTVFASRFSSPRKTALPNACVQKKCACSRRIEPVAGTCEDLSGMDPEALDARFRKMLLQDMNLDKEKADDLVQTMDRSRKIQLIHQNERSHQGACSVRRQRRELKVQMRVFRARHSTARNSRRP